MSWPIVKLGDVVSFIGGSQPAKSNFVYEPQEGFVRLLQIRDYKSDKNLTYIPENSTKKFCTKHDVMIGRYGPPVFQILKGLEGAYNVALMKAQPSEEVNRDYLYHFLKQEKLFRLIDGLSQRTAGQSGVDMDALKEYPMLLPPLDEQKRIAAILDKADAIRRKRQQAINLADDFLRSVFLEMFGDPITNPKGWEVKKFGDVIDVLTDYHANGSYKTLVKNVTLLDEPNYAYMVRTTDLEKKSYTDSVKYIDQHAYEHLAKSKVFGGEIIMNKIGSAGAVYLMPHLNKPVSLAMNQFMIRCNELSINEFMYYQLKTEAGAREISQRVQGAVTKTITKDAVRDVSIILPPLELQQKFIEIVTQIKELKRKINCSFDLTKSEFNSLSQKAFADEL